MTRLLLALMFAMTSTLVGRGFSLADAATLKGRPTHAETKTHVLVIVGLAGDPEHGELFRRWAGTLVDSATGRFGIPKDRVAYLAEDPAKDARATGTSTRDDIARAFATLSKNATADDVVFVVLIGHGTFDGKVAKFNLPGPDMTPADFAPLVAAIPSKHLVFVNTASSSAPFIAELAAPGRTIVTATRTGAEKFATLFGGYFIDALTSDAADVNRNNRVSVLEAFDSAEREVARAYEKAGTMLTEHPLLDDSGDREGSPTPTAEGKNGREAAILSLGAVAAAEPLTDDPKLRALYAERRELEQRVEALTLKKSSMDPAQYASELEKALTDLALKSKQIRDSGGKR
jgi:hypothetical protein